MSRSDMQFECIAAPEDLAEVLTRHAGHLHGFYEVGGPTELFPFEIANFWNLYDSSPYMHIFLRKQPMEPEMPLENYRKNNRPEGFIYLIVPAVRHSRYTSLCMLLGSGVLNPGIAPATELFQKMRRELRKVCNISDRPLGLKMIDDKAPASKRGLELLTSVPLEMRGTPGRPG